MGRAWKGLLLCGVLLALPAGVAGAQSASERQYASPEAGGGGEIPVLQRRVERQDQALRAKISEISELGQALQEAQSGVEGSRARADEFRRQERGLKRDIASQKASLREARARYEERARAAYQGDDLEGLAALLDRWIGSGDGSSAGVDARLAHVLFDGRQDLDAYEQSGQTLQHALRRISRIQGDYEDAVAEREARAGGLRRQEQALDRLIADLRSDRNDNADRLEELEAAERERILRRRAASGGSSGGTGSGTGGGGNAFRQRELRIAGSDIVARPVEPIPRKRYMTLYKRSAAEYGFGRDWYVLAAVGRVESDHGRNMGPSSAGAMGPMQFLPSTWETSGVDGNGDGVANVMDPEDAIPAAAQYLKTGGAPDDWYAALFSYNHADWYVKKVFAVAEAYRRLENDDRVRPYS